MSSKTVYQYDIAGLFQGETTADESPLEPGVFLMPARTTEAAPPETWAEDKWPRWDGSQWRLVTRIQQSQPPAIPPDEKLRRFLEDNPDVAGMIGLG